MDYFECVLLRNMTLKKPSISGPGKGAKLPFVINEDAVEGSAGAQSSCKKSGLRLKNCSTTCSFSSASREQVAYTRVPPGRRSVAADCSSSS